MKREKNIENWTTFFEIHYDMLFHYGLKLQKNEHEIEENIQDLFVYLYEKQIDIDAIQYPKAYLLTAFRRKILKNDPKTAFFLEISENEISNFEYSHEDFLIEVETNQQLTEKLSQALNELPTRQREVIYLKYFDNLKTEQISQIMDISQQAVLNTLYKAMKGLRGIVGGKM